MTMELQRPTTFGLLRHGQTVWNLEKRIQGSGNSALTQEGHAYCHKWGRQFSADHSPWQRIIVSPLPRTRETARIINSYLNLPVKIVEDIREQHWGQWEGRSIDEIEADSPGELEKQVQRGWQFRPPGGESREEVRQRVFAALKAECTGLRPDSVLVISHLGVIRAVLYGIEERAYLPEEPQIGHKNRFHTVRCDGGRFSIIRSGISLKAT